MPTQAPAWQLMNNHAVKYSLVFIVLTGCLFCLLFHLGLYTSSKNKKNPLANASMNDAIITLYNSNGEANTVIRSPLVEHFNNSDQSTLLKPKIKAISQNHTIWNISAHHGLITPQGKTLILDKHVVLHQEPDANHPETLILTTHLTYYPQQKIATTPDHTRIIRAHAWLSGDGARLNLNSNTLQLLSHEKSQDNLQQNILKQALKKLSSPTVGNDVQ